MNGNKVQQNYYLFCENCQNTFDQFGTCTDCLLEGGQTTEDFFLSAEYERVCQ